MDDLPYLVTAAQDGDLDAFAALVGRYQDLVFAAAYARLGDAHLAQDAAQEAFLQAHRDLPMLREPGAFPSWLRRIVAKHTDRLVRGKRLRTVSLEAALETRDERGEPSRVAEAHELAELVRSEIARLPERERVAVTLFYLADRAQSEIAAFLEVPPSTIKKRLYDARRRMKERMMEQLGDSLRPHRPSQDDRFAGRVQFLIAVRTGDVPTVRRQLAADPSLVHATLTGEEWGRAEMGQPTLPLEFDYTPLHVAATYGQLDLARVLLAQGADVDDATPGETSLDRAVIMHDVPMVELLVEHGANPNHVSPAGLTPLHRAALRGRTDVVQQLLAHGADRDAHDRARRTPFDWAALGNWQDTIDVLRTAGQGSTGAVVPQTDPNLRSGLLGRVLDPSGHPLDGLGPILNSPTRQTSGRTAATGPVLETGIKVLDLLTPLPRGGTVRLSARGGVGLMVLLAECSLRLARAGGRAVYVRWRERFYRVEDAMREQRELGTDDISTIVLGQLADPPERRKQALLAGLRVAEGFRDEGRDVLLLIDAPPSGVPDFGALRPRIGTAGGGSITLLVFDLLLPNTGVELPALAAGDWDTRILFDVALARRGLYPAIDPLASTSRLLENGHLPPERARVARRIRSILEQERSARADAPSDEGVLAGRVRRIEQFQTQPFFVAQPWTAQPGETVPLGETLASYTALADGAGDSVAEEHFAYRGGLSQVLPPRARGT